VREGKGEEWRGGETYEGCDYVVWVGGWLPVPVLRNLLLAWKPDVCIVGTADGKEGLENIAVKISLDIFHRVLSEISYLT
jgi:hypothetical protein